MTKLWAILALFRKGNEVANPAAWKAGQITSTLLAGFLLAAVHAAEVFGYALPIDSSQIDAIAAGILAIGNVVLTITTSKRAGLPSKCGDDESPRSVDVASSEGG